MRIRTIKPDFFKHDELAALEPIARLLFIGLWCMADRAGRLEDRPLRIKAEVLPYDDVKITELLDALVKGKFIQRYEASGLKIINIQNFEKHQRLSGKEAETESKFPALPAPKSVKQRGSTGEAPGANPGTNGEAPGCPGREGKGKEGKGYTIHSERAPETTDPVQPQPEPPPPPPKPSPTPLAIYDAYPRKQGRPDALKAIEKAIARGNTPEKLLADTQAYAAATVLWNESDRTYIPHPATWFNADRFDDDRKTWVRQYGGNPHQEATPDYTKSFWEGTGFEPQKP